MHHVVIYCKKGGTISSNQLLGCYVDLATPHSCLDDRSTKADLLLAVLAQGVPHLTLEENCAQLQERGDTVLLPALRTYLESGEREGLVQALESLLNQPDESQPALDTRAG